MHSPRAEWAMLLGHGVILDVLRDHGDPDGDTASEVLREVFRVDTPLGRTALAATIAAGGLLAYRHLVNPAAVTAVSPCR